MIPIPRHRRTAPVAAGFTLLELLVAVALFSVVSLMAFGGMRSVMEAESATRRHGHQLNALQRALHLMARDVEQAVPRGIRDALGDPVVPFRGGSGGLVMELTGSAGMAGGGGLRRVAYRVSGERLERLRWGALDRPTGMVPEVDVVLAGVEDHRVRFLAAGSWTPFWPPRDGATAGASVLPEAVEVSLTLAGWGDIRRLYRVAG